MISTLLLATTAEPTAGAFSFLPILLAVGFIFLITLPQRRMRKQQQALQESLEVGDMVRTVGGIHGRILSMDDSGVLLEVEDGKLRMERRAIAGKLGS